MLLTRGEPTNPQAQDPPSVTPQISPDTWIVVWSREVGSVVYMSKMSMPKSPAPFISYNNGSQWVGPEVMYACIDFDHEPSLWVEDETGHELIMTISKATPYV